MNTIDLTKLTAQQLKDELAKRAKEKASQKETYKNLCDDNVPLLFEKLKAWSDDGVKLKTQIYNDLKALIELKFEAYEVKPDQQSHTFSDKNSSITIGYNINAGYDDTVYLGAAKVKEFINSQIKDESSAKLVNQIHRLLRQDKKGNFDPKRIMELEQMANEYNNLDLIEGVKIIKDAYQPKRSSWFIKAAYKNDVGIEQALPLSMASIEFPQGFDLSFLLPENK